MHSALYILVLFTASLTLVSAGGSIQAAENKDTSTASVQSGVHHINYAPLKQTRNAKIITMIDPLTAQLDSGEILRLSGIDLPDYTLERPGPYSLLAMEVLNDLLSGQAVTLYQTPDKKRGRTNRMKHTLAHIERTDNKVWAQGMVIKLGLARVRTSASNPELATAMYALEREARAQKTGIWSQPQYAPRTPENLENAIGSVQIVKGRVHSTAINNNRIYINFGPDWRRDFTLTIAPEDKNIFYRAGIDPLSWSSKIIEARGWIDEYNGPSMDLTHPEAVQIIEDE